MNVAAHQEKNEKTGKRKAGEERRQGDFKEAACCLSAVAQGAAREKNVLCEESVRGNWDPREGQQPFRPSPNGIGNRTITLRRLLIRAVQFCSLYMYIYIYIYIYILYLRQKFRTSLSKRIGVNRCFGDGPKVRNDD